ncbi:hypothetical protein [Peribacillus butanolivorans]|uniref:hypothetical protein n=1 Tax=Peribacillus butanolivorans TaxID=421767 RepID=UPI0035D9DF77
MILKREAAGAALKIGIFQGRRNHLKHGGKFNKPRGQSNRKHINTNGKQFVTQAS